MPGKKKVTIRWTKYTSYDSVKDSTECIYLHENSGKPLYWGICVKSVFGGSKRLIRGRDRSPRYGPSYKHWINVCLINNGAIYIGECLRLTPEQIRYVEFTLIQQYPTENNLSKDKEYYELTHKGEVPSFIGGCHRRTKQPQTLTIETKDRK